MRLSYVLLSAAAILLASCETTTAVVTDTAGQTKISHISASDVLQAANVAANAVPSNRRLRAARATRPDDDNDDDDDDDDEERGFSVSADTVRNMLSSKSFRRSTFAEWDQAGRAYNDITKHVTDPTILRKYRKYLGITLY
ncbi:hypothetical protein PRIC1_004674 [Phytophthora ramorum]|uniref:RxLR effector protein n=1 Tax=Phytophthora ramorum TaxID=164328 RepID=H3GDK8_PHYRM|nr:hypothetical protein KRP23_4423 [Phytophthora ramorum]KAH7485373.1 hypothetical protein KRP23_4424 [Phytophthora ramorum]KAH7507246.1 hypothetical protein KRP22_2349 [Phytophthora ramorum]KAH7507247.1 hypothetical protein KRP22_2350 [Phytophthora ramorum]